MVAATLGITACVGGSSGDSDTDSRGSSGTTATPTGPGTTTSAGTTAGPSQTPGCSEYMDCIQSVDPGSVDLAGERYGPSGTCWSGTAAQAQTCDTECIDGVERLCEPGDGTSASTTGEPGAPPCKLSTLAPGAPNSLVAGEGDFELPTEIGEVIDRNCGCHLSDNEVFAPNTPLYYGTLQLSTYDDFHANFQGQPVYVEVDARTITQRSMPPLFFCGDPDGLSSSLSQADRDLFSAWLVSGAPDAPTWADARSGGSTGG